MDAWEHTTTTDLLARRDILAIPIPATYPASDPPLRKHVNIIRTGECSRFHLPNKRDASKSGEIATLLIAAQPGFKSRQAGYHSRRCRPRPTL